MVTDKNPIFETDLSGPNLFILNVFTAVKGTQLFIFITYLNHHQKQFLQNQLHSSIVGL